ncbi:glycosyltransferase family 9 protein [Leeia aquatica]|uniref:Glycosyltransferase family 9 protein n=1 Tax=Leeia aquatica TaxID=2725557 RepID=A0A847SHC4_9NEIS|nr:glycosyltransferase family 9 protein [Leeia aquatica]NLR76698.1 glycosyltransferase family 9 protein [Leeia aquatica]
MASPSAAALHGYSLIDARQQVWLPYDVEREATANLRPLHEYQATQHAGRQPFRLDHGRLRTLHVLNGMGVALGDSIIGISALAWLKAHHPDLHIHLYRARHAPRYVEALYQLASPLLQQVHYLPQPLPKLDADAALVDLADIVYWPQFDDTPMIDFFLSGLGIDPARVPAASKANDWLQSFDLPLPAKPWRHSAYLLFCPRASVPLRSIPQAVQHTLVEQLWQHYQLPVLGFEPLHHPHYYNVAALSPDTFHFLSWVRGASLLVSTDTAAVHAAAGFGVPTLAGFVSIAPWLRTRDYPLCHSLDLRLPELNGLHHSDDKALEQLAVHQWRDGMSPDALKQVKPRSVHR